MDIDPGMWLNSVRAIPAVGLRFKTSFDAPANLLARIKGMLIRWEAEYEKVSVSIEQDFSLKVERSDGIEVKLTPDQVMVRFYYISKLVDRGQPLAVVKYQSDHRPFSELCKLVRDAAGELYLELAKEGNRHIRRIGVVAEGNLDHDALPPGFDAYMTHLASPWQKKLIQLKATILIPLDEDETHLDRCHHLIEAPLESKDSVVTFKLDWQRVFKERPLVNYAKVMSSLDSSIESATQYFGVFGMGDLTYAD